MIKVIDEFLPNEEFILLHSLLMGDQFPWCFNPHQVGNSPTDTSDFFFSHTFFKEMQIHSMFYMDYILPFVKRMNIHALYGVRANLLVNTNSPVESLMHNDQLVGETAIFYVNSNNGFTRFEDGKIVESVENRLVMFDSTIKHQAVSQTNVNRRVVINFNYIPKQQYETLQ